MSAEPAPSSGSSDVTAGFLSVLSIVGSAIGIAYQPVKVLPFAFVIGLIAVGMARRDNKLPLVAIAFGSVAFLVGIVVTFFELLIISLQAYIFVTLTAVYVAESLAEEH